MNTYYDNQGNLRDFPWIKADELGPVREHIFTYKPEGAKTGRQYHNRKPNRNTEIFITVEFRGGPHRHGWLTRNETTDKFTNMLFQDSRENQHIHFVEWNDPCLINCVVEDGIYISSSHFFMKKDELLEFVTRWTPPEKEDGRV